MVLILIDSRTVKMMSCVRRNQFWLPSGPRDDGVVTHIDSRSWDGSWCEVRVDDCETGVWIGAENAAMLTKAQTASYSMEKAF